MNLKKLFSSSDTNQVACDPEALRSRVKEAYSAASQHPEHKHPFPVGRKFAESIGYPAALLDTIPPVAWQAFVGVSNVSIFAAIPAGATIIDLGCGAGLDSIIAAHRTGSSGKVFGLDFSEEMLQRARQAVDEANLHAQIQFQCAAAEALPIEDCSADIVLVNGIFNLNPHRGQVFSEISRVLKSGGRLYAAEIIFTEPVKTKTICRLDDWFA